MIACDRMTIEDVFSDNNGTMACGVVVCTMSGSICVISSNQNVPVCIIYGALQQFCVLETMESLAPVSFHA